MPDLRWDRTARKGAPGTRLGYVVVLGDRLMGDGGGSWVFWKKADAKKERRAYSHPQWLNGTAKIVTLEVRVRG